MIRGAASFAAGVLFLTAAPLSAPKGQSNAAQTETATLLKPGASIERTLDGSKRHAYDIQLQAGEFAAITVDQVGVDVVVRILDTLGAVIAVFDDEMRKDGREHVAFIADTTRPYRVTVSPRYPTHDPGRYAVRIEEIRTATDRDRALYEARRLHVEADTLRSTGKFAEAVARTARAVTLAESSLGPQGAYVGTLLSVLATFQ